jgi:20S proteasome alpha/beta subunit
MAMARTDHATFKASSDVATLWAALKGGLTAVHTYGGGAPLAMPLFGNGQSGINLAPQHLLRLVTLALVDFGRNSNTQLPKQVTVILHDRCFEELDIREIARDWKKV